MNFWGTLSAVEGRRVIQNNQTIEVNCQFMAILFPSPILGAVMNIMLKLVSVQTLKDIS